MPRSSLASFAVFHTSLGDFTAELFDEKTPETVANFVGLATGKKDWTDPKTKKKIKKKPLYNGTVFHRVIKNFMVQAGDPLKTGMGGPGYRFRDEIVSSLRFMREGRLAMANSGPGTNGSQFFITVGPAPHLNNKHTIFGEIVSGISTVYKISEVEVDSKFRPKEDIVIKNIEIRGTPEKK